jgi:hypothetical protein
LPEFQTAIGNGANELAMVHGHELAGPPVCGVVGFHSSTAALTWDSPPNLQRPAGLFTPEAMRAWSAIERNFQVFKVLLDTMPLHGKRCSGPVRLVEPNRSERRPPHAARGWARPPCRPFKIQSCCCLGSAFELAAFQTRLQLRLL